MYMCVFVCVLSFQGIRVCACVDEYVRDYYHLKVFNVKADFVSFSDTSMWSPVMERWLYGMLSLVTCGMVNMSRHSLSRGIICTFEHLGHFACQHSQWVKLLIHHYSVNHTLEWLQSVVIPNNADFRQNRLSLILFDDHRLLWVCCSQVWRAYSLASYSYVIFMTIFWIKTDDATAQLWIVVFPPLISECSKIVLSFGTLISNKIWILNY